MTPASYPNPFSPIKYNLSPSPFQCCSSLSQIPMYLFYFVHDCRLKPALPVEAQHGVRPGEDRSAAGSQDRRDEQVFVLHLHQDHQHLLHHHHHHQVPEGGLQHRLGPHGGERLAKQGDRHRDQRADHEQEPSDKDNCFQTPCLHHRQASFFFNRRSVKSGCSTVL